MVAGWAGRAGWQGAPLLFQVQGMWGPPASHRSSALPALTLTCPALNRISTTCTAGSRGGTAARGGQLSCGRAWRGQWVPGGQAAWVEAGRAPPLLLRCQPAGSAAPPPPTHTRALPGSPPGGTSWAARRGGCRCRAAGPAPAHRAGGAGRGWGPAIGTSGETPILWRLCQARQLRRSGWLAPGSCPCPAQCKPQAGRGGGIPAGASSPAGRWASCPAPRCPGSALPPHPQTGGGACLRRAGAAGQARRAGSPPPPPPPPPPRAACGQAQAHPEQGPHLPG